MKHFINWRPGRTWISLLVLGSMGSAISGPAVAQMSLSLCGGTLENGYGPYDYRSDRDKLPIVEGAHFTVEVENLIRGRGGPIGGDIDYTLRAFPNHHRALLAMVRFSERTKSLKPPNARWEVECYFVRAVAFRPNDVVSRMLFAQYLNKLNRKAEAIAQLNAVQVLAGDNPFTHYNLGLGYLEVGEHEKALVHAHQAAALGFPRQELTESLKKAGRWREPDAATLQLGPAAAGSVPR